MRTTIDIDDELLRDAIELTDGKTKKAVVEEALRELVNARRRERLLSRLGKFDIDLTQEELRRMRGCDEPPLSD